MTKRALLVIALCACGPDDVAPPVRVGLQIVDETGARIPGARVAWPGGGGTADEEGRMDVRVSAATLALVTKPGYLDEPLVLGRGDAGTIVVVKLWQALAQRWTMHSAGDVMFGRRYLAPVAGAPLIPADAPAAGARHVVSAIQPAFAAATVRTLNLESVVSDLGEGAAYPGKRFILNSAPGTLAAIEWLGADAVDLANNHHRDFLEPGITATREALGAAGLHHFGSTEDSSQLSSLTIDAGPVRLGVIGWTSVDGSFVNDNYPVEGEPVPPNAPAAEQWQYDARPWGFMGVTLRVTDEPRRIGTAWRLFDEAEATITDDEAADAWRSMSATYPELQDWVGRRGHGGAAVWDTARATAQIQELRKTVDLVVVQLHAGFQFQSAPSPNVREMAHAAIDAGAGIVICHHPHVVQGAEWYKGKLIVYSLGNFVFDQDFASTFPSLFLRTIWDGTRLVEARLIPLELVGYRPMAAADALADRNLLNVWEMSVADTYADRDVDGAVRVFTTTLPAETRPAQLRIERHTARIVELPVLPVTREVAMGAHEIAPLPRGLVDPELDSDLEIGRDLLAWGHFEDDVADDEGPTAPHWNLDSDDEEIRRERSAFDGIGYLRLTRWPGSIAPVLARPVARTTLVRHRYYDHRDGIAVPLDPVPRYTVRLRARRAGVAAEHVRLDMFHFDDTDPTEDPVSTSLGRLLLPLDVPADDAWHEVELEVPDAALTAGGVRANQIMLYLQLDPPAYGKATLDVDAVELLEWRRADEMPDRLGRYDYVRNLTAADRSISVTVVPP